MQESTGMGMGWGWKKFHGDGAGLGLIFTTVSLFSWKHLNMTKNTLGDFTFDSDHA